jgi:hypothetical protein
LPDAQNCVCGLNQIPMQTDSAQERIKNQLDLRIN